MGHSIRLNSTPLRASESFQKAYPLLLPRLPNPYNSSNGVLHDPASSPTKTRKSPKRNPFIFVAFITSLLLTGFLGVCNSPISPLSSYYPQS
ncbi:hypothetical protein WAI453_010145 [Rhynchosporium graminicola]